MTMQELQELYQQLILDHGRQPRHFGALPHANGINEGFNPLCGDRLTLYVHVIDDVIVDARFEGQGCAISMASTSLMLEAIIGCSVQQALALFQQFHQLLTQSDVDAGLAEACPVPLGKLQALAGVKAFPMRVKCATLAWHTLVAILKNENNPVTTE